MTPLEQRLGYKFRNPLLLAEALTHPSLAYETQRFHFDNQRLEFLGDAVLQLVYTRYLFDRYPGYAEGQLTKLRARIVSREGLKARALQLGLGDSLLLGKGEERSGGRLRAGALADAFEAVIGAVYLDSDFETVQHMILRNPLPEDMSPDQEPLEVNPKGHLQEMLQALSPKSPLYVVLDTRGPEHSRTFTSAVYWLGAELGRGTGSSKKEAEIAAALDALTNERWKTADSP